MIEMEELCKELDIAYRMISNITVSGDAVDMIATARAKLRKVYAELKKKEVEANEPNSDNCDCK